MWLKLATACLVKLPAARSIARALRLQPPIWRTGTTVTPLALSNAVGIGKNLKGGELTTTFSSLVTAIKDATKDRIEKLEYDKLGKVSKKTDGLSNSIASVYNLYGELEQQTQQVTLGTTKTTLQDACCAQQQQTRRAEEVRISQTPAAQKTRRLNSTMPMAV